MKGIIKKIGDLQTFESGFKKKEVLIETLGQYPQLIPIDFVKDNTDKLNGISEGDEVEVQYNIRGNEYNGRHYVNLQGWAIKKSENGVKTSTSSASQDKDDLPF